MMKNNDKIKWFAALGSTNDYIMDHLRELPDRTIVAAKAQTDGKGLGDNRWYSEPDQSLTFSYLLSPAHVMARQQFLYQHGRRYCPEGCYLSKNRPGCADKMAQ
ncbi:MAG: hypothetical protein U5L09_08230 [Bacteroidales bacterium]|nr:hypothetical protein [Bacteroidales bacterium]